MGRSRKPNTDPDAPPRPINCFLAFRLDKYQELTSKCPTMNHRDMSKVIALQWKEAPDSVKNHYRQIARKAHEEHLEKYPDYRYAPKRDTAKNKKRAYQHKRDLETRRRLAKENDEWLQQWCRENGLPTKKSHRSRNRPTRKPDVLPTDEELKANLDVILKFETLEMEEFYAMQANVTSRTRELSVESVLSAGTCSTSDSFSSIEDGASAYSDLLLLSPPSSHLSFSHVAGFNLDFLRDSLNLIHPDMALSDLTTDLAFDAYVDPRLLHLSTL
ncbi:hypothetical protein DM01DRAFT_1338740 [Hesseltinella vesiculosa]|uniref:HMG box domain-containing protein n=1 Tax=Hesseltinella vesiculosa TaxID=101127 RepID=A0A1X2G9B4_9FUNG|nr:hypothetical protein DM01DRAFT_1338740 [Hesseltinella vesiculosa]